MQPLTREYARKIAHLFKIYLGLDARQAAEFASLQETQALIEHRAPFGKFWRNNDKWYIVSCYDKPPRTVETMILMVNEKLAGLKRRHDEGKPAWILPVP